MLTLMDASPDRPALLPPGTRVEVLTRYIPKWSRGFEVVAAGEHGYVVRRISDAQVLPAEFDSTVVRPA